jgi:translation factor GUF1, mitochondrial
MLYLDYIIFSCYTAHIGDTIHRVGEIVEPMAGFKPAKAMVCSFFIFFALLFVDESIFRCLQGYIPLTAMTSRN